MYHAINIFLNTSYQKRFYLNRVFVVSCEQKMTNAPSLKAKGPNAKLIVTIYFNIFYVFIEMLP